MTTASHTNASPPGWEQRYAGSKYELFGMSYCILLLTCDRQAANAAWRPHIICASIHYSQHITYKRFVLSAKPTDSPLVYTCRLLPVHV